MNKAIARIAGRLTPSLSIDETPIRSRTRERRNRSRSRLGETVALPVIFGFASPLSNDIVFIWRRPFPGPSGRLGDRLAPLERVASVAHMFSRKTQRSASEAGPAEAKVKRL
jgi:hypothetical protein